MSDEMPSADVLQRILNAVHEVGNETRYDRLVAEAYSMLDAVGEYADMYESPEETLRSREYNDADRAAVAAQLAQAEQMRINNLIALASVPSMNLTAEASRELARVLSVGARARALAEAIHALGLKGN